ncbi:MAG: GTP 3',8-cyclase MoaA [Dehalococcoidia bacterium]|nr:GTP 3',8-cyclase MoaA [Dehalococcoidia bacterium]
MTSPHDHDYDDNFVDSLGRSLRDLRISVTDRCNFRCQYCMPKEIFGPKFEFLRREEIMSFEEITRIAKLSANLGVTKFRLTGGEPLLRADIHKLVGKLHTIPDVEIALTTNGTLLKNYAQLLAESGLNRVTVSLDSLDDQTFRQMNDVDFPVETVLEGIEAADHFGLGPIKINAVVRDGVNDHTLLDLAEYFRGTSHIVRFIEYMDVGNSNGWILDEVLPSSHVLSRIGKVFPLEKLPSNYSGEVASRYRYKDGAGEIGLISSITAPFCGSCTRARLSADGKFFTCLFASNGTDILKEIRSGVTDRYLIEMLKSIWVRRDDQYSELRTKHTQLPPEEKKIEMSYIGG